MERKERRERLLGRSIVLERQERFSIETSERIYFRDGRLYTNPSVDVARASSSSDDIEKIHRTRERVENLNNQINYEIERLKEVNNRMTNKKDERLMTWAERFRANPPLTRVLVPNREHRPGRESRAYRDYSSKQKDMTPRNPPPKALPLREVSPKAQKSTPMRLPAKELSTKEVAVRKSPPRAPSAKEPPPKAVRSKERTSKKSTSRVLQGKELPPRLLQGKELPPRFLPVKELPPKRLPAERNPPPRVPPTKEPPPKAVRSKELASRKPPPRVLPAKELPPKRLPPKELASRKPPPRALPAKELPPKGEPSRELASRKPPPRFIPTKELPSRGLQSKEAQSKELASRKPQPRFLPVKELAPKPKRESFKELASRNPPSRGLLAKELPPKAVPVKELSPKGIPPKDLPPKGIPPKDLPPKGIPPKDFLLKDLPPKHVPPRDLPPRDLPPKDLPPKRISQKEYSPEEPPPRQSQPKSFTQKEHESEKQPPKEVTTRKPKPKEEPIQIELGNGDYTTEELPTRVRGGCCRCYCYNARCYYPADQCDFTDPCCNIAFNQGVQYGIPYCTARRRVTDLNTQGICGNRCVGISPERTSPSQHGTSKASVSPSRTRESSKDKEKSPVRGKRASPIPDKVPNQKSPEVAIQKKVPKPEKQQRIEIQEKVPKPEKPQRIEIQEKVPKPEKQQRIEIPEKIIKEKPTKVPRPEEKEYQPPKNIKKEEPKISLPKTEVPKLDVRSPRTYCDTDQLFNVNERMCKEYLSLYYLENSKEVLPVGPKPTPTYTRLQDKYVQSAAQRATTRERQPDSIFQECEKMKPSICDYNDDEECVGDEDSNIELYPNPFNYESCSKDIYQDRRPSLSKATESESTNYESLQVKPPAKTAAQRRKEIPTKYPSSMTKIPLKVYKDKRINYLSSATESNQVSQSPTTDSRRQTQYAQNPTTELRQQGNISSATASSRYDLSQTTDSRQQKNLSSATTSSRYDLSQTTDSRRQSNLTSETGSAQMPQSPTTAPHRQTQYAQNPATDSRRQTNLASEVGSSRNAQNPTTDSRQQRNLSTAATSSRYDLSQATDSRQRSSLSPESSRTSHPLNTTHSSSKTIRGSPKYPSEKCSCKSSSYDDSDDERFELNLLEAYRKKAAGNTTESKAFKDAFSMRTEKTLHSGNESSNRSCGKPISNGYKSSEISEEEPQETVRRAPMDSSRVQYQSKPQNLDRNGDYLSRTVDTQSRCECDGYETARSIDSNKYSQLTSCRTYTTSKGGGETPMAETVCEKRTRTVTFKDEQGELNQQVRQVQKQCPSNFDWEQASKYRRHQPSFSNDNYSARSSSSAEHTCLESCSDEEAYNSCIETLSRTGDQTPPLKACPCMYKTYCQLAALCQSKNPHYR